jgi:biopolymer transport protein ExbD
MASPGSSDVSDGTQGPYQGWPAELRSKPNSAPKKKSKRGKRHFAKTPPISITSLTDMVTMLLVYLLKTFATNPVEVKDPSIEVPHSACIPDASLKEGDVPVDGCGPIDEATIVMITGPQQKRTVNNQVQVSLVTPRIVLDGKPVAELDGATYRVPNSIKDPATGNFVIIPLREALKHAKEIKEVTAQVTGKKFDGKVIILADKATPYRVLTDVLVTCGDSGFADFRFAVIRPE